MMAYTVEYLVNCGGIAVGARIRRVNTDEVWLVKKDDFIKWAKCDFVNAKPPSDGVFRAKSGDLDAREVGDLQPKELLALGITETPGKFNRNFRCPTRSQAELESLLAEDGVKRQRAIKKELDAFCDSKATKILGIYGLRRTGKSVLMRSKALELMEQGRRVVYFDFELNRRARFDALIGDLKLCAERKIEYVFIDEITFLSKDVYAELSGKYASIPEFPDRGMEIYGHMAPTGAHVIISGTDSYCLSLAKGSSLYDRMVFLHTTYISYNAHAHQEIFSTVEKISF